MLNPRISLDEIFKRVGTTPSLLILDYDGTLAPLIKDRMEAFPYPGVDERLKDLQKKKGTRTVIVSGRSLKDLEVLLKGHPGLELWGSHGMERRLSDGKNVIGDLTAEQQKGLDEGIRSCKAHQNSEACEVKPFSVALHWRGADPDAAAKRKMEAESNWKPLCEAYELEIHPFDGGIELRPRGRNKGEAVRKLIEESPQDAFVAYLGDDLTDEDAFKEIGEGGLKVLVRSEMRPTLADIVLEPPHELLSFLDHWISKGSE